MTTPNDWHTLPAGPDLDAVVADLVMGMATGAMKRAIECGHHELMPRYSTDISAAWIVVDAMRAKGHGFDLCAPRDMVPVSMGGVPTWTAQFYEFMRPCGGGDGDTPALAIVRAALETVEVKP